MDLFNRQANQNLLPFDGEVFYYGHILENVKIQHYYNELLSCVKWKHDELLMFGKW